MFAFVKYPYYSVYGITTALLAPEDVNVTADHCTAAAMAARHAYHVRPRDNRRRRPIPGRPPSPSRPMGDAAATTGQPLKSHRIGERAGHAKSIRAEGQKPTEPPLQSHECASERATTSAAPFSACSSPSSTSVLFARPACRYGVF